MLVSIYRYNPDTDDKPVMRDIEIELPAGKDLMVLDVLELVKQKDPSVVYRRSCREGVCGSDGMNINGKNGLACITPVSEAVKPGGKLVLRPLPGLPVIRDLIIDMSMFYKQYEKVKPYLINDQTPPAIERLQSPEDRESWTDSTNAFSALVAVPTVPPSGGTRINLLVRLDSCRPIDSWPIAEIPQIQSGCQVSKILLAYFVVAGL